MQGNWLYILCRVMVFLQKFSLCFPQTIWFLHPKLQRFSSVSPRIGSRVNLYGWEMGKVPPESIFQELKKNYLHIEFIRNST